MTGDQARPGPDSSAARAGDADASGTIATRTAELRARREASLAMGGGSAVAKHRESGRLPVRERLALLCGQESWFEVGGFAEPEVRRSKPVPVDAVVTGFGTLDGRRIGVIGIDATAVAAPLRRSACASRAGQSQKERLSCPY